MLSRDSPNLAHWAQNLSLIVLSLICLPISNSILIAAFVIQLYHKLRSRVGWRDTRVAQDDSLDHAYGSHDKRTILLTGLSMTKSLTLLRLLSKHTSYKIVGADTSPLCPGRFSVHCHKFRLLTSPDGSGGVAAYKASLLKVIEEENVGLWVSCSGVMGAVEDAEVREQLDRTGGQCRSIQFGVEATRMLHEKELFMAWLRSNGFDFPETVEVRSREAVLEHLYHARQGLHGSKAKDKRFILKPTGVMDAFRADMTLLPLESDAATRSHVNALPINPDTPWLLQEYIVGRECCTHALVVAGAIRNFVACPSAELLMHYEALPTSGKLSMAMLDFTRKVAQILQDSESRAGRDFTGHLSFDFLIKHEDLDPSAGEPKLYPIECNPRVHTAVALFRNTPRLVEGFVDVLQTDTQHTRKSRRDGHFNSYDPFTKEGSNELVYPLNPDDTYWVAHDLVELFVLPILRLVTANGSLSDTLKKVLTLANHLVYWRDGAFDVEDPIPAWWLYQVYWPAMFASSIWTGKKWSRINVSTTKMFGLT